MKLHRDYELRSPISLKTAGVHVYAADSRTEMLCASYAVGDDPVKTWRPGDPVPEVWFEAKANTNWTVHAHNDAFESAIELRILHPRFGFPLIPPERHNCTQARALAHGLPASLSLLADVLELAHRKDKNGERLMHQMSRPRKPRKGEDPNGIYYFDDEERMRRLIAYNIQDVECERDADDRLPPLSDAEQALWALSNRINQRGFHVDRQFAEAARRIAKAAGPEIDAELSELTAGAVTGINQVARLLKWLQAQGL